MTAPTITTLVTKSNFTPEYTANVECDVRTAVTRAVAEYLATVSMPMKGAEVRFKTTHHTWAENEEVAVHPAAIVTSNDPADYDDQSMTPQLIALGEDDNGNLLHLNNPCEFVQNIVVEAVVQSTAARRNISMLLERAFNPVEWMYGLRLVMPHYHGAVVELAALSSAYMDNEEDAKRRLHRLVVVLGARAPLLVPFRAMPRMKPRAVLEFTEGRPADDT